MPVERRGQVTHVRMVMGDNRNAPSTTVKIPHE